MYARIVTPGLIKDIDELRTWDMNIRQVLSARDARAADAGLWARKPGKPPG